VDLHLTDRTFIVTGGTSGLGRAAAAALVAEGANVLVAARTAASVEAAVDALGERAAGAVVDITDDDAPARLIAAAREAFGRLDGAFVSHGGPPPGPATELDDDALDRAIAVASRGPIRVVRELVGALGPGGAIVVLTSMSSVQPIPGLASSNVTRPAVWAYVKSVADEVAPQGIRVNCLLPGRYATERLAELEARTAERQGSTVDEVRASSEAAIPLRRLGDPTELGQVAAFLLSDRASYVTGAAWAVDGGALRGL
jgi:3-oxoacyl-[acyl-carrier protein] reductase